MNPDSPRSEVDAAEVSGKITPQILGEQFDKACSAPLPRRLHLSTETVRSEVEAAREWLNGESERFRRHGGLAHFTGDEVVELIAHIRHQERERAAKIAEEFSAVARKREDVCERIAAAIRED